MTHTYALLELSKSAYEEIAEKLRDAGYAHAFGDDGEIDMHGLAVTDGATQWRPIDSAPKDQVALFWIRAGTLAEGKWFSNTSGEPIFGVGPPRIHMGKHGTWSSLSIATHWAPLPEPPDA